MIDKIQSIVFFLIFLSLTFNSKAERVHWSKQQGAEYLPPFCGTSKNPKYAGINWKQKLGQDLTYINHYCAAKITENSCFLKQKREKEECIALLTKEYTYSISHAKNPNYKLLPFLHTEVGTVRSEIDDLSGAIKHYNIALKKNPKYIKAYVKLAKTFIKAKNYSDASDLVDRGLSIKKTKSLLKLKKQLISLSK